MIDVALTSAVERHQAGVDQRPHEQDEAGRVAARVGDPLATRGSGRAGRGRARAGRTPSRCAVRCAVLASIRQVVGFVTSATASRAAASGRQRNATSAAFSSRARSARILAQLGRRAQHLDVAAAREVLVDAKAGGAFLAVDEDARRHGRFPLGDRQHKARADACLPAARLRDDNARFMATKKPKGLGMGLEALLGPPRRRRRRRTGRSSTASRARLALDQLQPGSTSRARAWTRARSTSSPRASRRRASCSRSWCARSRQRRRRRRTRYEIIAGERRFRAAQLAGLDDVPVLVRDVPDEAAAAMALIENIQREDLNPLEEAQGLQRLTDEFGLTHEQAAQRGRPLAQRGDATCCAC